MNSSTKTMASISIHFDIHFCKNDSSRNRIELPFIRQCRKQLFLSIENLIATEFACEWISTISHRQVRRLVDSKVEVREDFDRLKNDYENLTNETKLLKVDFDQLMDNCQ